MAEWSETFRGTVLSSEYDAESHMNTPSYVTRFDQATWFILASIGVTPAAMKKAGRRIAIIRQSFQYLDELRGGQLLRIESGFIAVGTKHLRFQHRMFDAITGKMVASSDCTAVEASLKTGKAVNLPAGKRKAAEARLVTTNVAARTGLS
jgi:acyl-CoA thioester hydrolase